MWISAPNRIVNAETGASIEIDGMTVVIKINGQKSVIVDLTAPHKEDGRINPTKCLFAIANALQQGESFIVMDYKGALKQKS